MAGSLGDLVIRLGLDIAGLRGDVGKATGEMKRMFDSVDKQVMQTNRHMQTMFAEVQKGASRAAAGMKTFAAGFIAFQTIRASVSALDDLVQKADALGESAEKVGLGAEQLQRWQYAARLSGVETEQFDSALVKLLRTFDDAAEGGKSAQEAFARLGLTGAQLAEAGRDTETLFRAVTQAINEIEDPIQRAALAAEFFGKAAGPQMLAAIRDGFDEVGKSATGVFSDETAKAASDFNDAIDKLKGSFADMMENVFAPALPVLTDIALALADVFGAINENEGTMQRSAQNAKEWRTTLSELAIILGYTADAFGAVFRTIQAGLHIVSIAGRVLISLYQGLDRLLRGDIKGAWEAQVRGGERIVQSFKEAGKSLAEIGRSYGAEFSDAFAKQTAERLRTDLERQFSRQFKGVPLPRGIKPPKAEGEKADRAAERARREAERQALKDMEAVQRERENVFKRGVDAEEQLLRDRNALAEGYLDAGLIDLTESYRLREAAQEDYLARTQALYTAEIEALRATLALAKTEAERVNIQGSIVEATAKLDKVIASVSQAKVEDQLKKASIERKEAERQAKEVADEIRREAERAEREAAREARRRAEEVEDVFTSSTADFFTGVVEGTKSVSDAFTDMADSIVQSINRIAAQRLAESIFGGSAGSTSGSGSSGWMATAAQLAASWFGGGGGGQPFYGGGGVAAPFAAGGSFGPGQPILVGERGPELIVPSRGGSVIPNGSFGGNVSVTVNVPPITDRRTADQAAASVGLAVQRAMRRNQ